jgi:poly-beta-1,6-N-acetyl-D-glucosamine synthase
MTKSKLPFVCSGANLAYKKEMFLKLEPYKDNLQIASGDDMFLLKRFYENKLKIEANFSHFAPVFTPAEDSLKKMLSQRLRWASKTSQISTFPVVFMGLLVLLANTLCIPALLLGFINGYYWPFSLFTLTLKFIIDFLLLFLSARMYQQKVNWLWLPLAFLFNGLYVPSLVVASVFVKPTWKSRSL